MKLVQKMKMSTPEVEVTVPIVTRSARHCCEHLTFFLLNAFDGQNISWAP